MAINITDGFNVLKGTPGATFSDSAPIDYRMVVDDAAARTSLLYKYDGMKVFQRDNRLTYVWNSSTSTWSIDQNLFATGSLNYIPKVTSTSPIINYGNSAIYCDSNNRVGINTNNPTGQYTYLQIGGVNSSEDPYSFPGQALPLVFHKGANALIAYNYYYDGSGPQVFDFSSGSSLIGFEGTSGSILFYTRSANSSPSSMVQSIYIDSSNGWVGIGPSFQIYSPPTAQLDVIGLVKSNSISVESDVFNYYYGIEVRNSSTDSSNNKRSALSFWGKTTTGVEQNVVDIYAQSRGSNDWTKSSLVLRVYRRNTDGSFHSINGIGGYFGHQMELKEDGTLYYGPYRNSATLSIDPDKINGSSLLFPNTIPTIHVITGITASSYNNCMVLRNSPIVDTSWASAVTRRLGYIMKLSNESNSTESFKNGGMILESNENFANNPSLFLVTSDQKRLEIDATQYGGNFLFSKPTSSIFDFPSSISKIPGKKLVISKNDIIADIHNNGSFGIGDSGNQAAPWLYPAISSGEFNYNNVFNAINCSSFTINKAAWMRVGNVVTVSGSLSFTIDSSNQETSFKLKLPIKSNIRTYTIWKLNGIAKIRYAYGGIYNIGDVALIEGGVGSQGFAFFKFKPTISGAVYMTYIYQYIVGN